MIVDEFRNIRIFLMNRFTLNNFDKLTPYQFYFQIVIVKATLNKTVVRKWKIDFGFYFIQENDKVNSFERTLLLLTLSDCFKEKKKNWFFLGELFFLVFGVEIFFLKSFKIIFFVHLFGGRAEVSNRQTSIKLNYKHKKLSFLLLSDLIR